jgi:hypothetical protein
VRAPAHRWQGFPVRAGPAPAGFLSSLASLRNVRVAALARREIKQKAGRCRPQLTRGYAALFPQLADAFMTYGPRGQSVHARRSFKRLSRGVYRARHDADGCHTTVTFPRHTNASRNNASASGPFLTFASRLGRQFCECQNQRATSK